MHFEVRRVRLAGELCLITGASRGLGRQLALSFWRHGASIALVARTESDLQTTCSLLGKACGRQESRLFICDISQPAELADLRRAVFAEFGEVTVLVNNAAILGPIGPLQDGRLEQWQSTIAANLLAPMQLCCDFIPAMRARKHGKVINVSGGGAATPRANFAAYAASKAALVRFSETLALELEGTGVDVNCLAPGMLPTSMTRGVIEAGPQRSGEAEVRKAQQCDASANPFVPACDLAVFLASAESDGITGRLISAVWDSWQHLPEHRDELRGTDVYTLRRIIPSDRGLRWKER